MGWSYNRFPFDDPAFEALRGIQSEFNRIVDGGRGWLASRSYPAINVWGSSDELTAAVELPGVKSEDVEVTVLGKELTIKGKRKKLGIPEGANVVREERLGGDFARSIELPFAVHSDQVRAKFEDGILTITLPRAPEDRPRKVTIMTDVN